MRTATQESSPPWSVGTDLPYVMRLPDQRTVALTLPAEWVLRDKTGVTCLRPPAVRWLDRMRSLFADIQPSPTAGFIRTLREALNLTQQQFGERLGIGKMSVSRWERGTMKPAAQTVKAMVRLRTAALHQGLLVDAEKR